jgi:nuclease S1
MPGHLPHGRSCFVTTVTLLLALQTATPVWAWGRLGHRLISRLAEKDLNPTARRAVAALLEPGESLADASTWADEHRRELPKSAPWHYVDVPLDEPRYNALFSGDIPEKGCVVDKIHEFKVVLKDPKRSVEDRRFALRFLIHCIEDLHMPLHVGDNNDKGGNQTQVRFFDQGTNMHRLWDSQIIEHVSDKEDFWLTDLTTLETAKNRAAWAKGTVEDWATESLLAARQAYQVPETGRRLKPGQKLADAYQSTNLPVGPEAVVSGWHAAGDGAQRGLPGQVVVVWRPVNTAWRSPART